MSISATNISSNEITPHLFVQLDPALERVLAKFRLLAKRRAAWLRKLWSEEGEPGGKYSVTHAEIDTHLNGRDAPEAEAAWIASDDLVRKWNDELIRIDAEMAADNDSRLTQLRRTFNLDDSEFDLFQVCLAVALDPSLSRVCGYLQDHAGRAYMTEHLAARMFRYVGKNIWTAQSPLQRWRLLIETEAGPGEPSVLACDPRIREWLLGSSHLDPELLGIADFVLPQPALRDWPVDEATSFLESVLTNMGTAGALIRIVGPQGSGRRTLAAVISSRLGLPLLAIDSVRVAEARWDNVFVKAQRQGYLEKCAIAWYGERVTQRIWPRTVTPFPVQFLISERVEEGTFATNLIDYLIEIAALTIGEREELWRRLVPTVSAWGEEQTKHFIERHRLTVGQMAAMGKRGVEDYAQTVELVREVTRHRLGKLAQLLECPFSWDDLVLTDELKEALRDLLYEAKSRARFWERPEARRLYPQGRGLIALFSGPPGTGKTMAAQVIAADLGVDLFRIDLSTVVSKYVGETSQNLEQILSRAAHMDAVLLFDEADALFGKRTEIRDAHDRFANTDTGYLLQAIENYQGVALLTTNKKGNIDPGFIRRIRYVFEFPKPDALARLTIWERIVGELADGDTLKSISEDLKCLAHGVEMTGAQIKFALLAALFASQQNGGRLQVQHLLRGIDHEFAKEGRALSEREREALLGHG
jgi:adenylate kinase family enzyme